MERERSSDRARSASAQALARTVTLRYAIFLSPATYSHLRSRLHHRGSKVLLAVHRCALLFFILAAARSSVCRSVGCRLCRSVGSMVGAAVGLARLVRSWAFLFVVYGQLTSHGLSLSAFAASLTPSLLHLRAQIILATYCGKLRTITTESNAFAECNEHWPRRGSLGLVACSGLELSRGYLS